MQLFRNLSIGRKLYGMVGLLVAFMVIMGILAIKEIAASAQQLSSNAETLTELVSQFKVA